MAIPLASRRTTAPASSRRLIHAAAGIGKTRFTAAAAAACVFIFAEDEPGTVDAERSSTVKAGKPNSRLELKEPR